MTTRSLTWSTHNAKVEGNNTLASGFPSFQLNAADVRRGAVKVEARSPSGRVQDMGVIDNNGVYTANFTPTEVGRWRHARTHRWWYMYMCVHLVCVC